MSEQALAILVVVLGLLYLALLALVLRRSIRDPADKAPSSSEGPP